MIVLIMDHFTQKGAAVIRVEDSSEKAIIIEYQTPLLKQPRRNLSQTCPRCTSARR